MKKMLFYLIGLTAGILCAAETVILAENGVAKAGIVVPEKTPAVVELAAGELKYYLDAMTGADFVITKKPAGKLNIYLGFPKGESFKPDHYVIRVTPERVDIYGKDDPSPKYKLFNLCYDNQWKGTLTGVYRFLLSQGVRWPAPGKRNEFIPKKKTLRLTVGEQKGGPFYADRKTAGIYKFLKVYPDGKEYVKNIDEFFLWTIRNGGSTRAMVNGAHSERSLRLWLNKEWLAHPERWQTEKNGKKNSHHTCWTDPAVAELWEKAADAYFSGKKPKEIGLDIPRYLHSDWPNPFISPDEFMIDPEDNGSSNDGICYCSRCQEWRKKHPAKDDTDMLWTVVAKVAESVKRKHPGKYISTLVYHPKKDLPSFKVPDNIRVRICISGPKELDCPEQLKKDVELVTKWRDKLGKDNLPLWIYQCVCHGRTLPGVPDTYPRKTAEFLKMFKPLCAGMFQENYAVTHTFRNLDVYIFLRMAWDPDLDVEKELNEYFTLLYGPAAKPVSELFHRLEQNWSRIWPMKSQFKKGKAIDLFGSDDERTAFKRAVWSRVYTEQEMKELDALISQAEKLSAGSKVYKYRTGLLRKYLYDVMIAERDEIMRKEELRKNIRLTLQEIGNTPSATDWKNAPVYPLISAVRMGPALEGKGSFKALAGKDNLYFRIRLEDPKLAGSKTDAKHVSGGVDIWKDNCVELFFYTMKSRKFRHFVVNDNGAWTVRSRGKAGMVAGTLPGVKVQVEKDKKFWTCSMEIPRSVLKADDSDFEKNPGLAAEGDGELRFNLTRERRVKKGTEEFSTWSSACMLGNWMDPGCYGTLQIK